MTRFAATDPEGRRALVVDALAAHRERASPYVTLTTDPDDADREQGHGAPWVQFFETTMALDCTDDELDRLKALAGEYPAITVEDLVRPEESEGTHARLSVRTDDERVAQFVDEAFQTVFDRPAGYRLWAVEV
ncbi:hypothetical protein [Haloarchaeobius sp. HRN-SO-5]|uniref:hypothetical protein n=1 Tax=Haloarchaeobius sp. HRN-SO-5 TaxID=3446118 RepID=UPI003EBA834F